MIMKSSRDNAYRSDMKSLGVVVSLTILSTECNLLMKESNFNLYNIRPTYFSVWIVTLTSSNINFIYSINYNASSSFDFLWWGLSSIYERHLVSRKKRLLDGWIYKYMVVVLKFGQEEKVMLVVLLFTYKEL